jgi:hypothetical protein
MGPFFRKKQTAEQVRFVSPDSLNAPDFFNIGSNHYFRIYWE